MELWTSWIQRSLEKLSGKGVIGTNNLITVLNFIIRTNGVLLSLTFDNRKLVEGQSDAVVIVAVNLLFKLR